MISFEIQTYVNGDWKIDSVFDDRELAVFEARRAADSGRYAAIRVIEEKYDEADGSTATRVVFRSIRADKEAKARREVRPQAPSARQHDTGKAPARKPKKPKPSTGPTRDRTLLTVLIVLLVFALGFAGIVALSLIPR